MAHRRVGLRSRYLIVSWILTGMGVAIALAGCSRPAPSPSQSSPRESAPALQENEQQQSDEKQRAIDVIQGYFEAINQRDYERAYASWSNAGAASGQSFEQFRDGFADTASVQVRLGEPGRLEGAAGSLYVIIPVTITSTTQSGAIQQFQGSYTLRRVNDVPGSTPEERLWHIESAEIARMQ